MDFIITYTGAFFYVQSVETIGAKGNSYYLETDKLYQNDFISIYAVIYALITAQE